jgi:hypothetical protein
MFSCLSHAYRRAKEEINPLRPQYISRIFHVEDGVAGTVALDERLQEPRAGVASTRHTITELQHSVHRYGWF